MAKRFIKLYEQITRWGWYTNVNTAHLFIHLLLKANYGESECAGQKICRGQMLTSLPALAADTGLTVKEVRTALAHLVKTGEVADKSTNKFRLITITKYNEYQASETADPDRQKAAKGQTGGSPEAGSGHHNKKNKDDLKDCLEKREDKEAPGQFVPPTVAEVRDYVNAHGLDMTSSKFIDYYTGNGWMIGSTPMTDWRAAARVWAQREKDRKNQYYENPAHNYHQRDYSGEQEAAVNRMMARIEEEHIRRIMEMDD